MIAEPYFADLNSVFESLISWFANDSKIPTSEENPFLIELSSQPGTESENEILFRMENSKNPLQKGEGKVKIKVNP